MNPATIKSGETRVNYRDSQFGPRIGNFMGKPIFQSIDAPEGRFVFDRLARYADDGYPLDQLSSNEVMFPEGVIYHRES